MFLSGLNNVDFSGIGSLSGELSEGELYAIFRPIFKPGTFFKLDDGTLHAFLSGLLGSFKITNDVKPEQIDDATGNSIKAEVTTIVLSTIGAPTAGAYESEIRQAMNEVKSRGYVLVPRDFSAPAPATAAVTPSAAPVVTGTPSRAAVLNYQASQATQSLTPTAPAVQFQSQRNLSVPQRVRRPYRQTPAEKQRLLWIVAGFAAIFAVTLGVIAARD